MKDGLTSLSFSMESNKGVYALLLGSGISYSASIPTGWGILKLLCKRIMELEGECEQDEIKWYTEKFGKEPLYDEIIGMLAKTPSERNGLLSEFFEPSEEDIQEGRKVPTEAHRSIANLVSQGYVRVIVTTNFDRLLEQAMDELNVQYQTLYHESDIGGMKPLAHAECTVLKIHGDYRDTRFKNITDELSSYPEPINEILGRIFDEYGLIVSGWSAEWDTALRDAIKCVKGRRYSWYWHSFNDTLSEHAKELVKFRDGSVITDSQGADHFFSELYENVSHIKNMKKSHPDNLQVRIKRLKSYIFDNNESQIRDLLTQETKIVLEKLNTMETNQDVNIEKMQEWIKEIKEFTKPLAILTSIIAYYGKTNSQIKLLIETLERLTSADNNDGKVVLIGLKYLPIQSVFYGIGISLVMAEKYKVLNDIFTKPRVRDRIQRRGSFAWYISAKSELFSAFEQLQPKQQNYFLPFEVIFLKPYMEQVFTENNLAFDTSEFEIYYDMFEFIRAVKARYQDDHHYFSGCFGYAYDRSHIEKFLIEGSAEKDWKVLSLFDNKRENFEESLKELVEDLNKEFRFNGSGLLESFLVEE
ncbi:SIR2 family protein [Alkalihalobacillus macyae]|uniref:SIR2 family protein n=1 Tax=Guptibacillus hwajinpoensis TaxID=208199 RepID=UPI00273B7543|nr:SIR2 family protein [Alkalihalobacillus macyae]MDP4552948.1 SIR2 family protein [Alkalihalobacillus macyae]